MAKDSRFKYEYRKNASKLHKAVGGILRNDRNFKHLASFQEYPVNKVNPRYPNGSHKFDWVVPKLKLVIECHGIQHYKCQTFGAKVEDAIEAFHEGKKRDKTKKEAALDAGWSYITVDYNEKVTPDLLLERIKEAQFAPNEFPVEEWEFHQTRKEYQKEQRKKYLASDKHKQKLAQAREYRKSRYKMMKELKDGSD